MKIGKVYLVGAGPGDVGLATLKAARCLQVADTIVYDHLVNPELLSFARKNAELVFAGKYPDNHVLFQQEINRLLVQKARQGKVVVRLKGGDPLLFGRGAEEALILAKARVPFEIVPGVSSAYSVPAYAGIPVTYRNISSQLNIVTGHETPDKGPETILWRKLIDQHATLVILMGFGNLGKIVSRIGADRKMPSTPVAVISNGTLQSQKVVTGKLSDIVAKVRRAGIRPPAVIVIGKVVDLRSKLRWFTPTPALQSKRILVTRPRLQAGELIRLLKSHGAKVVVAPLIRIVPSRKTAEIRAKLKMLAHYKWLIFTSVNGAELFVRALRKNKIGLAGLKGKKFAAIGRKTADELEQHGFPVALIPKDFIQEALADSLIKAIPRSTNVLLAHSAGSRPFLEKKLRSAGLEVDVLDLYSAEPVIENHERVRKMILKHEIDAVMLTSSSCVDSFVGVFSRRELKTRTKGVVIAAIGPVTAATARSGGLPVTVESREFTIEGVTNALINYYLKRDKRRT